MQFDPKWSPPEIELKPWQNLLLKTADLLENGHWTQHAVRIPRYDGSEAYCMLGAAIQIQYSGPQPKGIQKWEDHEPTFLEAMAKMGDAVYPFSPWSWNDSPKRTKEEVISKLREVANAV